MIRMALGIILLLEPIPFPPPSAVNNLFSRFHIIDSIYRFKQSWNSLNINLILLKQVSVPDQNGEWINCTYTVLKWWLLLVIEKQYKHYDCLRWHIPEKSPDCFQRGAQTKLAMKWLSQSKEMECTVKQIQVCNLASTGFPLTLGYIISFPVLSPCL